MVEFKRSGRRYNCSILSRTRKHVDVQVKHRFFACISCTFICEKFQSPDKSFKKETCKAMHKLVPESVENVLLLNSILLVDEKLMNGW